MSGLAKELNDLRTLDNGDQKKISADLQKINDYLHTELNFPNLDIIDFRDNKFEGKGPDLMDLDKFLDKNDDHIKPDVGDQSPHGKNIWQDSGDSSAGGGTGGSRGGGGGGGSGGGGDGPTMDTSALGPPISNGNEIEDPNNPVVKQIEADLGDDPGSQAVRRALSQLGVPYVYEGESPGQAFDCFGLTNWACGRAGESLPRTAAEQQSACTPVSMNQLKPGDLLFYGQPAHHVTMYVGHGMMVEAPHTGERVRLVPVRPPTSAGRPHS